MRLRCVALISRYRYIPTDYQPSACGSSPASRARQNQLHPRCCGGCQVTKNQQTATHPLQAPTTQPIQPTAKSSSRPQPAGMLNNNPNNQSTNIKPKRYGHRTPHMYNKHVTVNSVGLACGFVDWRVCRRCSCGSHGRRAGGAGTHIPCQHCNRDRVQVTARCQTWRRLVTHVAAPNRPPTLQFVFPSGLADPPKHS